MPPQESGLLYNSWTGKHHSEVSCSSSRCVFVRSLKEAACTQGTPKAACHPVPGKPGVFEREYTNAKVSIDCGSWKGSVTMADGRHVPMD